MNRPSSESARQKIQTASRRVAWACSGLMIAVPVSAAAYWAMADGVALRAEWQMAAEGWSLGRCVPNDAADAAMTPAFRLIGFALTMLPVSAVLLALVNLRRLFRLYARGAMFGTSNVAAFRGLGWALILFGAAQFAFGPLSSLALSSGNPVGQRFLSVGVGSDMVLAVVAGMVLVIVAWVMDEARRIDEEQTFTV
ncbi:MAG: DUF2975 domain-containing protein [Rhodospirillaceae bacterium]|nr:DUF2975 domain-containing protein [Rhodospirillaceae bacterium]